jgi:hypothetical protein
VALQQPEAMVAALESNGVDAKLVEIPGQFHSVAYEDKTAPSLDGETVIDASIDWLERYIAAAQPNPTTPSPTARPSIPPPDDRSSNLLLFIIIIAFIVLAIGGVSRALVRRRQETRL